MYQSLSAVVLLFSFCLDVISTTCPSICSCDSDRNGRKRVRCDQGQLKIPDSFSPQSIDRDTEVLLISAPPGKENIITSLNPVLFRDLKLVELHITNSKLRLIGDRTFFYLSNTLKVLNLADNDLTDIIENNFRNLSGLTHLHLDNNKISFIHSATFNYQRTLKVLTLANNRIYDLGARSLLQQQAAALEVVDLSGNPLGEVGLDGVQGVIPDLIFQDVPNIRQIRLANTSIDRLPFQAIARNCRSLEELDVSSNKFTSVGIKQFSELKTLRKLNLGGNPLISISAGAFRGMKLDILDLSAVKLPKFQADIFEGVEVKHLSIANNGLTTVDSQVLRPISRELVGLDVGGNPLTLREKMFEFAPNLKSVSLPNLKISRLPADFFGYEHKVVSLNLSHNIFQDLPAELLNSLPFLETLDISYNEFRKLPVQLARPSLKELHANHNFLQSVPDHFVELFWDGDKKGKLLRIHENRLECSWRIAALAELVSNPAGRAAVCGPDSGYHCPVCVSPEPMKGTPVDKIKVSVSAT